jgi:hypothetical protein
MRCEAPFTWGINVVVVTCGIELLKTVDSVGVATLVEITLEVVGLTLTVEVEVFSTNTEVMFFETKEGITTVVVVLTEGSTVEVVMTGANVVEEEIPTVIVEFTKEELGLANEETSVVEEIWVDVAGLEVADSVDETSTEEEEDLMDETICVDVEDSVVEADSEEEDSVEETT